MARYILDTNIISELARRSPDANVVAFIAGTPRLFVSVIAFHELGFGLHAAQEAQKFHLMTFLGKMRARFGQAAIPVDLPIAETAGRLRGLEKSGGRIMTLADSLMAATAIMKDACLVTRNTKDFETLEMDLRNPFDPS